MKGKVKIPRCVVCGTDTNLYFYDSIMIPIKGMKVRFNEGNLCYDCIDKVKEAKKAIAMIHHNIHGHDSRFIEMIKEIDSIEDVRSKNDNS